MLIFLSPSKSVTAKKPPVLFDQTAILFPQQTKALVSHLQKLSEKQLANMLGVSDSLATLNYQRYATWSDTKTTSALWLYSGDVYNGLDAFSMSDHDVKFAQKHVRIVSGLYGLIRPLDGIKPYRLEMKLPYSGPWGENLYDAWSEKISEHIRATGDKTILMCASQEYAKAASNNLPEGVKIITPKFVQETPSGLKEKGLFAKYARGALARWIIDKRITSHRELQHYNKDGFRYSTDLSSDTECVYVVPKNFSLKGRFTKV